MIKRYLNKVSGMSESAKASFWFVVSNVALKGISFITTPIFTRMLNVADYGYTSVFVTWEAIISVFATLSLSGAVYNVAMTKYNDDIDSYTSSMYVLESLLSLFVYGIVIIFNVLFPHVFEIPNLYIVFMGMQTLTNAFVSFWLNRQRFNYKYKPVIIYSFANALLSPSIAIAAIKLFPNNAATAKIVGSGVFGILFGIIILIIGLKKGKTLFSKFYWAYAVKFNLPLLPHFLSGTLLNGADKLMIDGMISAAAAGFYSIAHSISGCMSLITGGINTIMIPITLKSIKNNDYKGLKKTINTYMIIIAFVCVVIMLIDREVVLILASEKYLEAIPMVPPLLINEFTSFIGGITGNIQYYYEKRWSMSFTTIICAVINIILNYFGIRYFGAIAASYTTLITNLIGLSIVYCFTRKVEKNMKHIINMPLVICIYLVLALYAVLTLLFETLLIVRLLLAIIPLIIVFFKRKEILAILKK